MCSTPNSEKPSQRSATAVQPLSAAMWSMWSSATSADIVSSLIIRAATGIAQNVRRCRAPNGWRKGKANSAGAVLPRRVYTASTGRQAGTSECTRDLHNPISRGIGDAADYRRRSRQAEFKTARFSEVISPSALAKRSSREPSISVSGVRNSWLTLEKNRVFALSISFRQGFPAATCDVQAHRAYGRRPTAISSTKPSTDPSITD